MPPSYHVPPFGADSGTVTPQVAPGGAWTFVGNSSVGADYHGLAYDSGAGVFIRFGGIQADGTTVTFKIPSAELKTVQPFTVTSGMTTVLTLRVDLARSIVLHGSAANFTPVLGAIGII